jgi:hypothetical protein
LRTCKDLFIEYREYSQPFLRVFWGKEIEMAWNHIVEVPVTWYVDPDGQNAVDGYMYIQSEFAIQASAYQWHIDHWNMVRCNIRNRRDFPAFQWDSKAIFIAVMRGSDERTWTAKFTALEGLVSCHEHAAPSLTA